MKISYRKIITLIVYVFGAGIYFFDYLKTSSAITNRASLAIQNSDDSKEIFLNGNPHLLLLLSYILLLILVWYVSFSVTKKSTAFFSSLILIILSSALIFYVGDTTNSLGSDIGIIPQLILNSVAFSLFPLFYKEKNLPIVGSAQA